MGVASLIAAVALVVGTAVVPARASDWPVFGHDPARSGVVAGDRALSKTMVGKLRERWQTTLDDVADSTPIFLSHVGVKGRSRAMLFQTAKNGTTYGIDARSGRIVWRFATHGPKITTSTPAADPSGRWIYAGGVDGFIHKLDAATGIELRGRGFPLRITQMPETEKDASALNLANGYLYAVTSGYYGDATPYVGHVVSVRLSDGSVHIFALDALSGHELWNSTRPSVGRSIGGIHWESPIVVNGWVYCSDEDGHLTAYAARP